MGRLQDYLPPGTYDAVFAYLRQHQVHLTIARERQSILGDYRHRTSGDHHRISVNGNLNRYAFLITLLHELAHLFTFEKFGNRVLSHGKEWKTIYSGVLAQFLAAKVFPADIATEVLRSLQNPAASTCAEDGLLRVLRKYDAKPASQRLVEEIPHNGLFRLSDGRVFQKGEKLRKRYRCVEVKTARIFLFSPVFEVQAV